MFKLLKNIVSAIVIALVPAQLYSQTKTGDVILDAMQDELWRSMKELKLPDHEAPFYIMYGVQEQKNYVVSARLGSLNDHTETPIRFRTNTRILVGSYEFNDESLDDNHFSGGTVHEIELPVDDDYYGIRRSFWASTDEVYRSAARHFRKHQQTLKESGKELKDIPHRSFAKSEPVTILTDFTPFKWNKEYYSTLVKNLSAKFVGQTKIDNSLVAIRFVEGQKFMVTSEGTISRVPFSVAGLSIVSQGMSDEGAYEFEQLIFSGLTPASFPDEKELSKRVDQFIAAINSPAEKVSMTEEYAGPVLVFGRRVGEMFNHAIFSGRDDLIASDDIPSVKGFQYDQSGRTENKIGKMIAHESLTVKARPQLKEFKGVDLFGHFVIGDEGMVPAHDVVLIENGVLKTMLDNRTTTSTSKNPMAQGYGDERGVIEVTSTVKNTEAQLKEMLLRKAKSEGLDYALIVRDKQLDGMGGHDVFRISVKDGKEELVKNLNFENPSAKALRKILGVTENYSAYNLMNEQGDEGSYAVTSFIVPDGVLLEEVELTPFNPPTMKEEHYVSNPLVK